MTEFFPLWVKIFFLSLLGTVGRGRRRSPYFGPNIEGFRDSLIVPIVSLLTPINFRDFMSVVNREMALVLIGSKGEGTGNSSLLEINIS